VKGIGGENEPVKIIGSMKATTRLALLVVALLAGAVASALSLSDSKASSESDRFKALPEEDRKWLSEFVAPIILAPEKKAFLELTEPREREAFKEEFWKRRERDGLKAPLGPGYRERYAELRRLAETQYDHWPNDAARTVISHGEPASIDRLEMCRRTFRDLEVWTYNELQAGRRRYLFYRRSPAEPRRMWTLGTPDSDVFSPGSCRKSFQELIAECTVKHQQNTTDPCGATGSVCKDACEILAVWYEVSSRQGTANGAAIESATLMAPPEVSLEGLDAIKQRSANSVDPDPDAKSVGVTGPSGSAAPTEGKAVPASAPKTLPSTEKERIAALPQEERKWLTEFIAPIILPEEQKIFLELAEPYQREAFKLDFWERRERSDLPPPLGPGYRYRYPELRRLADEVYDGWRQDAGRMVLRYGEPVSIEKVKDCRETFRDLEIWTYSLSQFGRQTTRFFFYRPNSVGPRKIWNLTVSDREVFLPNACRKSFEELATDCRPPLGDRCPPCQENCDTYRVYSEIKARQGSTAGAVIEYAKLFDPPKVSTEGLDRIKDKWATTSDPKAKTLTIQGPSGSTATASAEAKLSTPAPARRKLSSKEIKEATAKLEPKYRDWLTLVELIITEDERQVFLQIGDTLQRDRFIEAFWRRRSIDAQGIRNDFRRIYTDRFAAAMEQFHNLHNDRAKIFVLNGPPDAVLPIDCQDVYYPIQIWYYERLESVKSKVYLIFYQPLGLGDYKLWLPLDGENVLQVGGSAGIPSRRVDPMRCSETRTLRQAMSYSAAALGSGAMSMAGASKLFQPPVVETEGVDQILSMTTDLAAGSAPVSVTKLVRFPEQRANKIGVDLSLLVPKSDLKPRHLGEENFYNVDVIGEVVKDDRLIDNFKYRFDVPIDEVHADKIPLTVRRYLYPGEYKLILKISDGNQRAEGRITEALTVPEQPDAPNPTEVAARAQGRATVEKAKETGFLPSTITLLPVAKEIVTGLQRFETKVAEGIKAVDFYLNGAKVMTKTRPPFDADLNLGVLPRKQTIRVVGFGETGRAIGEDEYIVNEGHDIFRVRILSPQKGARVVGPTKVVAAAAVPEGKTLQKLEFYSNETRVATLYQPPFEQTITIRDSKSLGYVRIVGALDDGTVAEDLRYVNAPAYVSEVTVDAVELFTAVTEKGRPVSGLQASNFKVFEDGVLQKIESFESVKNLPLTLGVMVDTSASMLESLPEAQKAAIAFLDYTIGEKDRAFTISFDNEPYLLSKPTGRKDKLFRSMAGMRAEGSTALYDSIVYGLYQFSGVKGKKALVILTDGKDTASKFDFDTTLDYVRKTGIAIYGIGLKISGTDLEVKYKLNKLANVTGGQTFYIDSANHLEGVYRQINEELRSQYLLTYYSTNTAAKDQWRKIDVKVEPTHLQARTISGYYP
jgi:Ca-activated chloride channel family protein